MPQGDLTAQDAEIVVVPSANGPKTIAVGVAAGAAVGATVVAEVERVREEWEPIRLTRTSDDTRVASLGPGEAGWDISAGWPRVRVRRSDANGGSCITFIELR